MYNSNRQSLSQDWDDETLNTYYPELDNKYELLKHMSPYSIGFINQESYDHEISDKSIFTVIGECDWDEEHGFEIYFKSEDDIICG